MDDDYDSEMSYASDAGEDTSNLAARLNTILDKLNKCYQLDPPLPEPGELEHSGEMMIHGQAYNARSSIHLSELKESDKIPNKFTVYLHTQPLSPEVIDKEQLDYYHFSGKPGMSSVYIRLALINGELRQNMTMTSAPKEKIAKMIQRKMSESRHRH